MDLEDLGPLLREYAQMHGAPQAGQMDELTEWDAYLIQQARKHGTA